MRRFITTLAILLVVIVAGMTALVLLVNPNDFRGYMAQQVEQRSGYRLALNGDLRWHVWPQLSILSGPMTLTAPGASKPIVSASNMRLDVSLLPLISHQLSVKQVMLKGAVINLTPESETQRPADAPVGPGNSAPVEEVPRGWKFDIAELRVVDSLVIWQQSNGEQLNLRDFNLQLSQDEKRQAHVEFSSRVNRDQRELVINLNSDMDVSRYPQHLSAAINQLDYQMTGADLPKEGLKGQMKMQADWAAVTQSFSLKNLSLTANDSQLDGNAAGVLSARPQLTVNLHSPLLNMDSLLGLEPDAANGGQTVQAQRSGPGPVISQPAEHDNANSPLNAMDGNIALTVDKMRWRGMDFAQVALKASSEGGLLTLQTLSGKAGSGEFSLPGSVDVRTAQTVVALKPELRNIAVAPLLKAFDLPASLSGDLSLAGNFTGTGLTVPSFKRAWKGTAEVNLDNAQMAGLDFQQMIQRAVERNSDRVQGTDNADSASNLQQIKGSATLNNGLLLFPGLKGRSSMLDYSGKGEVNLADRQADLTFGVTVTRGWKGDDELVKRLQVTPVPLRIYGPWSGLNYSLQVDQVLRQQLQDEAKKRLQQWSDRNKSSNKNSSVQKLIKDL
ncbi:outer membrane assembly protein AsmA [Erwinia pyri]|uniref:Outer membrane assembly protein AsmA n=1 Tax=Erwinia pyri TaxID=3062598 RepID=A0AA50DLS4_9GAMM|nr:outer membrane assembly protein AsmA [Erwinia sp. DE2]WLS80284.1 outer membrane assembly protein AsmA [Erwinia sp. DE2]